MLFTLSAPRPPDEAELIVVGMRGAISRPVLRAVSHWAFVMLGLRRVVARIPADRADLAGLLRRAGFRQRGHGSRRAGLTARRRAVWAMTARACPCSRTSLTAPGSRSRPAHSLRVH